MKIQRETTGAQMLFILLLIGETRTHMPVLRLAIARLFATAGAAQRCRIRICSPDAPHETRLANVF